MYTSRFRIQHRAIASAKMSVENNKENLPEDFFDLKPQKGRRSSVSPKKLPKKTRSKSIGPGGVEATSKQDVKNRRKVDLFSSNPAVC